MQRHTHNGDDCCEYMFCNNNLTVTLWRPSAFGDFWEKNTETHVVLRGNFSSPESATDPVKISKDVASLAACTWKNFLLGGCGFLWLTSKVENFRPPWRTLPGPGRQLLDGSISLKFLLQTRLQSESFHTLDDLLGFQVQSYNLKQGSQTRSPRAACGPQGFFVQPAMLFGNFQVALEKVAVKQMDQSWMIPSVVFIVPIALQT